MCSHVINPSPSSHLHSFSCEGNLINSLDNSNPTRMLLKAIEAAGIRNVRNDDFHLALIQNGYVRLVLSINASCVNIFSLEETRFPCHFRGPKPGYNIPRVTCDATRRVYGAGILRARRFPVMHTNTLRTAVLSRAVYPTRCTSNP